jgi:hypothetical protein
MKFGQIFKTTGDYAGVLALLFTRKETFELAAMSNFVMA